MSSHISPRIGPRISQRRITTAAATAATLWLLLLAHPGDAHAHGGAAALGDARENLLVGADGGMVGSSWSLGAEVSWVRSRNFLWWGIVSGVRYQDAPEGVALSTGIEGGALIFGGDVSVLTVMSEEPLFGIRARGCVTLMFIGACGGGAVTTGGVWPELSGTIKAPIQLGGTPLW